MANDGDQQRSQREHDQHLLQSVVAGTCLRCLPHAAQRGRSVPEPRPGPKRLLHRRKHRDPAVHRSLWQHGTQHGPGTGIGTARFRPSQRLRPAERGIESGIPCGVLQPIQPNQLSSAPEQEGCQQFRRDFQHFPSSRGPVCVEAILLRALVASGGMPLCGFALATASGVERARGLYW